MALALDRLDGTPFQTAAATGMRKLLAAMQTDDATAAREMAGRVHLVGRQQQAQRVPRLIADALSARRGSDTATAPARPPCGTSSRWDTSVAPHIGI